MEILWMRWKEPIMHTINHNQWKIVLTRNSLSFSADPVILIDLSVRNAQGNYIALDQFGVCENSPFYNTMFDIFEGHNAYDKEVLVFWILQEYLRYQEPTHFVANLARMCSNVSTQAYTDGCVQGNKDAKFEMRKVLGV